MRKQTLIMVLGFAGFTVMADNWVVSPILPAIADNLGQEVTRAGLLITAYMLPFGLFQLVFGPLADRYGKRQVLSGTMLLFTIATALCAIAFGFTDLTVYRALTGVFGIYSVLAAVSTMLLFVSGRHYPSARNPCSSFLAPYGRLLIKKGSSLRLTLIRK